MVKVKHSDRQAAADLFHIPGDTADGRYLLLRHYLTAIPERFFARDVHSEYLAWLEARHIKDAHALRDYMADHIPEIERALLFLREINLEPVPAYQFQNVYTVSLDSIYAEIIKNEEETGLFRFKGERVYGKN